MHVPTYKPILLISMCKIWQTLGGTTAAAGNCYLESAPILILKIKTQAFNQIMAS